MEVHGFSNGGGVKVVEIIHFHPRGTSKVGVLGGACHFAIVLLIEVLRGGKMVSRKNVVAFNTVVDE